MTRYRLCSELIGILVDSNTRILEYSYISKNARVAEVRHFSDEQNNSGSADGFTTMDKNTIIAIVIIGVILLGMPYYYDLITPDAPEQPVDTLAADTPMDNPPVLAEDVSEDVLQNVEGSRVDPEPPVQRPADTLQAEIREVEISTPLFTAEFSTLGASVTSWIVLPTQPYLHEPEQLVRRDQEHRNLVLAARGNRGEFLAENAVFHASREAVHLEEGDRPESVEFSYRLGPDSWYRETYTFYPDQYSVDIHVEASGLEEIIGSGSTMFTWGDGLALTELDTTQDLYYTQGMYHIGNNVDHFKTKGKEYEEERPTGNPSWVAQRNKYFLMALVPASPADGCFFSAAPVTRYQGKNRPKVIESALVFHTIDGHLDQTLTMYLGPLDQNLITEVEPTLEKTISWGWPIIRPFSMAVLWTLKFLHNFIPNYGVVLLIFSVLIKLIVWPLTYKSHVSMKRMQLLQPRLKELQEKHKNNPQRVQKEMMEMYRENKVNPMGGCWPVLLQMPLLYSLFIVFRSTIELRGQPFVLWINDLSMPDVLFNLPFTIPLYGDHVTVLPIIMAVSTFLQSKQTMTDPNQKPMLYMMPLMFIFLFNNFPSGLTLYYTLFNLLSWGQQKMMKVKDLEPVPATGQGRSGRGKK